MLKVAINGFGRIGRAAFKVALEKYPEELEIVAINDLTDATVLAHLLQYDSAYGRWDKEVFPSTELGTSAIIIDNKKYPITAEKIPVNLHWRDLGVDVVIESTGRFLTEEDLRQHILAGAKKVVLSAPCKGSGVPTYLMGVNHSRYHGEEVVNNGSCTTNCVAPVAAIIQEKFGVEKALMTTAHAVTAEQNLVDGPPPGGKSQDLRRARAAYVNIIPTSTGAAISTTEAIPELKGKFDGRALRVPVIVGSISDLTLLLSKKTTVEEVNQAFKEACNDPRFKGVVGWSEEPLVSTDIIGNPLSALVDLSLTQIVDGDLLKIFAWYDNEFGYSNRLIEMVINIGKS
ncbi:type I glyceraldehyde-3-phosphate dehydrogenase [Candidatus Daviesbacteria bacterium]|nr:type I glyceraldehyde-3-phosphate dehydrogenase [Candidatus Daviesbacteria bacterium]